MAKLADDGFDENLLYTGFGELNNIEFRYSYIYHLLLN
jgi:hypothetical protein